MKLVISDDWQQEWIAFLDTQAAELDFRSRAQHGGLPFTVEEIETALPDFEDTTSCPGIEDVITKFIQSGEWPSTLAIHQAIELQFRAFCARAFISTEESKVFFSLPRSLGRLVNPEMLGFRIADPADRGGFTHWLLIELENILAARGSQEAMRNAFVAYKLRPKSRTEQLAGLGHLLNAQIYKIQLRTEAKHGGPFVADQTNVVFLQVDDSLNRPMLDQAIKDFIRSGAWPSDLTFAQLVNLLARITTASALVLELLKGADRRAGIPVADLENDAEFTQWLLIDAWNLFGAAAYIKGLTDAFLAEKSRSGQ